MPLFLTWTTRECAPSQFHTTEIDRGLGSSADVLPHEAKRTALGWAEPSYSLPVLLLITQQRVV
jgi:hypothetical protein